MSYNTSYIRRGSPSYASYSLTLTGAKAPLKKKGKTKMSQTKEEIEKRAREMYREKHGICNVCRCKPCLCEYYEDVRDEGADNFGYDDNETIAPLLLERYQLLVEHRGMTLTYPQWVTYLENYGPTGEYEGRTDE